MAGLGVFEEGGDEELDGVLLHAFIFFVSTFASSGILCETVSSPRLTRGDVTVMNKDCQSVLTVFGEDKVC